MDRDLKGRLKETEKETEEENDKGFFRVRVWLG